jgi:hypothetical protein
LDHEGSHAIPRMPHTFPTILHLVPEEIYNKFPFFYLAPENFLMGIQRIDQLYQNIEQ